MAPKSTRHHDTTSGLSWNETIISTPSKPPSSQIHDFLHRAVGIPPPLRSTNGRGVVGVDTLESMALRCLLNHLTMLETESLEDVPEVWLKRLWGEIQRKWVRFFLSFWIYLLSGRGFGMGGGRGRVALLTSVFRDDDGVGAVDENRRMWWVPSDLQIGL